MKKNKGFTLVELLAVIVLLGIMMTIAVPSAFKINAKVKQKAYVTKLDLIQQAAVAYGQTNIGLIKQGTNVENPSEHHLCTFTYSNKEISSVSYDVTTYSASKTLTNTAAKKQYWCSMVTVDKLVGSNNLDWDEKNVCQGKCNASQQPYYDNIVVNPSTGYIINRCKIYIYYRNNRIYAYFDKATCDAKVESLDVNGGHEYRKIIG